MRTLIARNPSPKQSAFFVRTSCGFSYFSNLQKKVIKLETFESTMNTLQYSLDTFVELGYEPMESSIRLPSALCPTASFVPPAHLFR
uniref:Uncharacterized protein n=1 Tax=Caenorhabditis tropicalis TaxID=1561998 RepID=A0A1I7TAX9_9PELO